MNIKSEFMCNNQPYFNASLMHGVISGKAMIDVCTFYNKIPVDWFLKQQSTKNNTTFYQVESTVRRLLTIC